LVQRLAVHVQGDIEIEKRFLARGFIDFGDFLGGVLRFMWSKSTGSRSFFLLWG
jgi:hypothetical protein